MSPARQRSSTWRTSSTFSLTCSRGPESGAGGLHSLRLRPKAPAPDHLVADVKDLLGFEPEAVERPRPVAKETTNGIGSVVGGRLRERPNVIPLDVLVQDVEQGF